jgi:S-adenosylmethionine:tRNA ribosyltransferase-isomerase
MNLSDFDYDLPERFIAQRPLELRDASRLLVLDRKTGAIQHHQFREIGQFLRAGDVLVLNNTRVIPARLMARKAGTGGQVEILMLKRRAPLNWEVLVGGKNIRTGAVLDVDGHAGLQAIVMQEFAGSRRMVQFSQPISPLLDRVGRVPLPPYIHEPLADPERYQTVYAQEEGSAAAPTAGLHFTPELLEGLRAQGVIPVYVTLHVGLDTFAPVTEARVEAHHIHGEWCELNDEAAQIINVAKREGRRIVAVGTTTVRTLETAPQNAQSDQTVAPFAGSTDLFILPGHHFRVAEALLTNFHLPKSTLLMLVSAFATRELILQAYETAKGEGYRFFSFGDAMLIV